MTATPRAIELAQVAALAAANRKAGEIFALDVSDQLVLTDVFVLASGESERQINAIVDAVEEAMYQAGAHKVRREGKGESHWVLLDFGDVVVHVQHQDDREFYALERLWRDCPVVPLPAEVTAWSLHM